LIVSITSFVVLATIINFKFRLRICQENLVRSGGAGRDGNRKATKMRSTFFYDFSNYGSYERLTDDGLTQWHPAFLKLGDSLEECARKYKGFCQKYKPKEKNTAIR